MDLDTAAVASEARRDLIDQGSHLFPDPVNPAAAKALLALIRADRAFDSSLFQSEADFRANPQYTGVNPRPGRNLLERFQPELAFLEQDPRIVAAVTDILGEGYQILDRKVVCGVPDSAVPAWVKAIIAGNPVNNLGAFMRPEYRDITYFYGIDFHQDLIDFKDRDADFLTLYCYLHPVGRADAPLFLLDRSHLLGATVFPHDLARSGPDSWTYGDRQGQRIEVAQRVLTGETGFAAIWHPCTLHGTQPDAADHERISLRYLLARRPGAAAGMDEINAALKGPLRLSSTRVDLAGDGSAAIKANTVNQA
jgi:hypothetical protein